MASHGRKCLRHSPSLRRASQGTPYGGEGGDARLVVLCRHVLLLLADVIPDFIALQARQSRTKKRSSYIMRPVRELRFSLNRPRFLLFVVRGNARLTALMAHWAIVPAEITPPPR